VVICDRPPAGVPVPVTFIPWSVEGEAAALVQGDIGIAPTPDDRWTLGKCGFKIIQYMAAGLPAVASPIGANAEIVVTGGDGATGFLPQDEAAWAAAIVRLARDADLRRRMGDAGRRRVEAHYALGSAVDAWETLLREARG
jgi:glycosyltransferase involved in cell wall biosynthesis